MHGIYCSPINSEKYGMEYSIRMSQTKHFRIIRVKVPTNFTWNCDSKVFHVLLLALLKILGISENLDKFSTWKEKSPPTKKETVLKSFSLELLFAKSTSSYCVLSNQKWSTLSISDTPMYTSCKISNKNNQSIRKFPLYTLNSPLVELRLNMINGNETERIVMTVKRIKVRRLPGLTLHVSKD